MRRLIFYFRYALQNLRGSGRWTTFAVLSVAAGVATVVALHSLGLAIGDSLMTNLRDINRGDLTARAVGGGPFSFTFNAGEVENSIFRPNQLATIERAIAPYDARFSTYSIYNNVQITPVEAAATGRPQFITSMFINPDTFMLTRDILAEEPNNALLSTLLGDPHDVVISRNLADDLSLHVGDQVRVTGTEEMFYVTGIVPTDTEANVRNIAASFFGFAYFRQDAANIMGLNAAPNYFSIVLPEDTSSDTIRSLTTQLYQLNVGIVTISTTPDLLERNAEIADMIERFIVVLGLGALLIGGVGIVNTMLVMVGRRSLEIASLKTFGMKRHQIALLFSTEAFLLGLAGSVLGALIGVLLSMGVNRFGELLIQQKLPWRFHPDALVFGFTLGMVVTLVFGVLPVIVAARIRPAIILRPNQAHIPRASLTEILLSLVILIVVLGFITGQIVGPLVDTVLGSSLAYLSIGMIVVAVILAVLALLVGLLWLVVWVVGHLPTFGSVDLRLALRNLTARRTRTATTLLALSAGMFALSSISFLGLGARHIVQFQIEDTLGGNVMVAPLIRHEFASVFVDLWLALQQDVNHLTRMGAFFVRLERVDGEPIYKGDDPFPGVTIPLVLRETDRENLRSGVLLAGRDLTPEDEGKHVIVLSAQSLLETALRDFTLDDLGIHVGSTVQVRINNEPYDFEVVGIVGSANGIVPNMGGAFIPPGLIDIESSWWRVDVLDVPPDKVNDVLLTISGVPIVVAVDVTFIDSLMSRLIDQMSAIPTIVGLLSLVAAAVIMGNTVSLATLERRRQIGVLKAMGLKRRRVLRVLLLENTLIGLLGGVLGLGISALLVSLMTLLGTGVPVPVPAEGRLLAVSLLVISVLIAWAATFFSARVTVNERVARVLRYE